MPKKPIKLNSSENHRRKVEDALKESEEHYRIFASYQRAISELRKFYMVDAPFEQIIQKTLDLIIEEFGYYMAWYAELIEDEKVILPKLWAGKYEKYLDGLRLEYESDKRDAKCAMSLAILTKKPFGYADLEHDKDFEKWRSFAIEYGYRSNQAIPFIRNGKCKSAFLIYSTRPFAFSDSLVEYLKGIVDELSAIIGNITERKKAKEALQKAHDGLEIRVEERTEELQKEIIERKRAEEEIKNKAEQLKTLYETGKKITSIVSEEKLLPWIISQTSKLFNASLSVCWIREGDELVMSAATKDAKRAIVKDRLKMGESLAGLVAKKNKPLLIPDNLQNDTRLLLDHRKRADRFGFRGGLWVPMRIGKRVAGVLNVVTKEKRIFTKKDVELLAAFADQAAIAIEKSRLFESLKKTSKELENSEGNLKKFSGKILSTREEEKKKIATNMHDALGSMAIDINASLSIAEKEIKDKNISNAHKYIRQVKDKFENMIENLKNIAADIRPVDLDIIGLPGALREYISGIEKKSRLKIDFNVDIDEKKLGGEISIALYRVAQEALNNVIKHAKAKKVRINLCSQKNSIKFNMSDNGRGFNCGRNLMQSGKSLKMGIIGMRERIESLGGTFNMKSAPKKGTAINITLPFKSDHDQ